MHQIHFYRVFTLVSIAAVFGAAPAHAATVYAGRPTFEATLATSVVDDYEAPGYSSIPDDMTMSAVVGETDYVTTFFDNNNYVGTAGDGSGSTASNIYCAGCNGSFLLSFTTTSVGSADGVYGVGLEFFNSIETEPYHAFVTFGDGSTQDIVMDTATTASMAFFGITSPDLIRSIHFGLEDGGATSIGYFGIDNLTLGSPVPLPAALYLFGSGLLLVFAKAIRRRALPESGGV